MITDVSELYDLDDEEFNRAVAELEGYRVVFGDTPDDIFPMEHGVFMFMSPGGKFLGIRAATVKEVWKYARRSRSFPNYASDLNAAWELCESHNLRPELHGTSSGVALGSVWEDNMLDQTGLWDGEHAQPARALATAWAAWKREAGA